MKTEESPTAEIMRQRLKVLAQEKGVKFDVPLKDIIVKPVMTQGVFVTLTGQPRIYEVFLPKNPLVKKVFISIISGSSSIVDTLVYFDDETSPSFLIEETKTSHKDSSNTFVGQRALKFVYGKSYFPKAKLIMLFEGFEWQGLEPHTASYKDLRSLITLDVTVYNGTEKVTHIKPYKTITEVLINYPLKDYGEKRVAFVAGYEEGRYFIQAKLDKSNDPAKGQGKISNDPSVGKVALMAALIRKLDPENENPITIKRHGVTEMNEGKFFKIAQKLNIQLEGVVNNPDLVVPPAEYYNDCQGEKNATIFLEVQLRLLGATMVFINHAAGALGDVVVNGVIRKLPKNIPHPDLVFIYKGKLFVVEGELSINYQKGKEQQKTFGPFMEFLQEQGLDLPTVHCLTVYGLLEENLELVSKKKDLILALSSNGQIHSSVDGVSPVENSLKVIKKFLERK